MAEGTDRGLIGTQLGAYKITGLLGVGGMGEVYRAEDTRLGRTVAVKVLPAQLAQDKDRLHRFVRKARAASALSHANVAHIYDIGESGGCHFIAMEYVEGQSLAQKTRGQSLELGEFLDIGIQAADALTEAYEKGITHRDIKSANLMITPKGRVKVLDFGLAKITRPEGQAVGSDVNTSLHTTEGSVMGTLGYMSPEQVLGKELDARTDLFSLGVVLCEMTTGRLPFSGSQANEVMDRILHAKPEAMARFNYDVPAELERIIRKCLEKDRERRYQLARDVRADLSRLKEESATGIAEPVGKSVAKPRVTWLGPYEILALLGTGGMGEVWKARDTRLNRIVAVKRLMGQHSDRFEQEARAIASLNHPNICQVRDVGPDYLVLEFIEGQTLADRLLGRARGLPPEEALRIARQIAEGLEEAHQAGILHRDLKPGNVMITTKGAVKLLDFGLARLVSVDVDVTRTLDGTVVGTSAYMSPEQAEGKPLDARSDIFSFGAVLYEMLSGTRAFRGTTALQVLNAVVRDEPSSLQTSPGLERIVRRCLQKSPGRRFQTMGELRAVLEQPATEPSKPIEREPSIAVLPFANMSADKENEYFSDGLAEEIINVLANVPGLKVAGRTSSFFFRGNDVEFGEIGRKLNVEHILEGSVRKAGNRIRVTAQLIKVADGFHLWSERYDREIADVFEIQDEIAHAISTALKLTLSPEPAPLRRHTPSLRAYEAYLKARHHWFKATPESMARVKEFLDQAVALDPEFGLAYSLLGGHYTMLSGLGIRPAHEVIPLARAAEEEALRIEPSLPEAHALLGVCAGTYDYSWYDAERHWRLAMAHEPVSFHIRFWYGNHYLMPIGRPLEAVEAMARGVQEDPLNLLYRHHFAVGLRHAGRIEDAEAELRKVLELDEDFPLAVGTLGAVCAQQGRFAEALTLTEKAHSLTPWNNPIAGQLAALLVRAGATSRADALLEKLRPGTAYRAPTGLAVFHALCGEFDQAAEWAKRSIDERYPPLVAILGPLLRSSPRWSALARMMNLPAQT